VVPTGQVPSTPEFRRGPRVGWRRPAYGEGTSRQVKEPPHTP
jgi:hypothetical protein